MLDGFSGRTTEVAEYLTEQVLGDLAPDLQRTLAEVAILDALNPELVADVTGNPAAWRRLLDEGRLEHFLVPLDSERFWFRLHHLLLDYLRARQRAGGEDRGALHARASVWFERHGDPLEAVRHAVLAGDVPRAAHLIERTGGWEMVLFGGTVRMRALLGLLPLQRIGEFPRVQIFQAFLAVKDGETARGLRLYESVAQKGAGGDPALARDLLVVGHLLGRYADHPAAAGGGGDIARSRPPGQRRHRPRDTPCTAVSCHRTGDMPAAPTPAGAIRGCAASGPGSGSTIASCISALRSSTGSAEAEATWREAAEMAEENFGGQQLKSTPRHLAVAAERRGGGGALLDEALPNVETTDGWLDSMPRAMGWHRERDRARRTRAAELSAA